MRARWKGGRERAVEREVSLTDGYNKFDFVNLSSRIDPISSERISFSCIQDSLIAVVKSNYR